MTLVDNGLPSLPSQLIEVKSKFNSEFRRVAIFPNQLSTFDSFANFFLALHHLESPNHNSESNEEGGPGRGFGEDIEFHYVDPLDKEMLPINNDNNYIRALTTAKPLLRLFLNPKGAPIQGALNPKAVYGGVYGTKEVRPVISKPAEFRQIAAIIDVDVIPETLRRVKLLKHTQDKPLGFFIRDGISMRQTNSGLKRVPGVYISRLVPGGLAEMTGLLSVNDEVLEVNGIDVYGKTLDQVTDMMVANSSNLIITVKPVNQRNNPGSLSAHGAKGSSTTFTQSRFSLSQGDDEEDQVLDLLHASTSQLNLNTAMSSNSSDSLFNSNSRPDNKKNSQFRPQSLQPQNANSRMSQFN